MKIFGREPAWWLALVAVIVSTVAAFVVDVSMDQQAGINAAAAALVGLITAAAVQRDRMIPAIVGLVQAVLLLGVTYGVDLPPEKQAILLTLTSVVAAGFVRTQVTAPVRAEAVDAPRAHAS